MSFTGVDSIFLDPLLLPMPADIQRRKDPQSTRIKVQPLLHILGIHPLSNVVLSSFAGVRQSLLARYLVLVTCQLLVGASISKV